MTYTMDLTYGELKALIKDAVDEAIRNRPERPCHLEGIGISPDEHKQHHQYLRQFLKDFKKLHLAFWMGIVTALSGGLAALLWIGFKTKV